MARVVNILFWLLLAAFVIEFSFNIRVSVIPGFSLKNIGVYSLIMAIFLINPLSNKPLIGRNIVNIPIVMFIAYSLMSLMATATLKVVPNYSLNGELILFKSYMDPYVLFIVAYSAVHDEKAIKNLLFALVVVMTVFIAITLLSSTGAISVTRVSVNERWGRTSGAFAEPNQFAAYIVTFIPLVVAFYLDSRSKIVRTILVGILIAALYVVLFTGSRGGLVALMVAMGVYYLLSTRYPLSKALVKLVGVYLSGLIVLVLVSFMLPPETVKGLISKLSGEFTDEVATDYSSGRFTMWALSLKQFLHSPIFGTGWKTFIPLFGGNSHNDYILFLVTTGLIGFYLYVIIYIRILKSALLLRSSNAEYKHFYNAFISGFVSMLVAMMFVNIYNPSYFVFLYSAFILKLGAVATKRTGPQAGAGNNLVMSQGTGGIIRRRRVPTL